MAIVTVKELAKTLNIPIKTIYSMIYAGTLRARKSGSLWLINDAQLKSQRWENRRKPGRPMKKGKA